MNRCILVSCIQAQRSIASFQQLIQKERLEVEMPHVEQRLCEAELKPMIDRFDGVLAGDDEFTAGVLERATRLKVISKWGVGVDAIDLEAARQHGIRVFNTPDVFGDEVADVVIGYIILLSRQLHRIDTEIRAGRWTKIEGTALRDKTLGIIGLGNIGQNAARRAIALKMKVVAYDVKVPAQFLREQPEIRFLDLHGLLNQSDFVSLNCNLTKENRHMLNEAAFSIMKHSSYLINTARGALIDEAALAEALGSRRIAGAALDVFEEEPLPADSALRRFDNCILGSHNSSNTKEALYRVTEQAFMNLLKGLK